MKGGTDMDNGVGRSVPNRHAVEGPWMWNLARHCARSPSTAGLLVQAGPALDHLRGTHLASSHSSCCTTARRLRGTKFVARVNSRSLLHTRSAGNWTLTARRLLPMEVIGERSPSSAAACQKNPERKKKATAAASAPPAQSRNPTPCSVVSPPALLLSSIATTAVVRLKSHHRNGTRPTKQRFPVRASILARSLAQL